jgi:glycosyltransferase involved in cell wall biosynthesis
MHLNQLPEGIILLGKVPASKLATLLQESDIYVHTSFIENSSNAICEAMLMGLPVIAAGVGGTLSIIEDGKTGYLYKKGDSKELCDLILDIFTSPDRGAQLGENAKEVALKRHDGEKIVQNLIMIYDSITSGQVDRESR